MWHMHIIKSSYGILPFMLLACFAPLLFTIASFAFMLIAHPFKHDEMWKCKSVVPYSLNIVPSALTSVLCVAVQGSDERGRL